MGWNGSDNKVKVKGEGEQRKGSSSSVRPASAHGPYRGLVAGLIVVALGCGAIWWFVGGRGATRPTEAGSRVTHDRAIAEVKPAVVTNKVEQEVVETKPKERPPQRVGETRDGKILLPNGRLHVVKGVITNNSGLAKAHYQIFDHPSENVIAGLLSIEPGSTLVGTPHYNGRITADFLESLKTPIIPSQEDSEHDRELKRAVNEAKIELKAAYDRGEDIEKILLDARAELQKLGRYKQELRTMALKSFDECATEEEMNDTIAAANKMLEAKGIAPMELSKIAKIKFRMKKEKENAQ